MLSFSASTAYLPRNFSPRILRLTTKSVTPDSVKSESNARHCVSIVTVPYCPAYRAAMDFATLVETTVKDLLMLLRAFSEAGADA